MSRGSSGNACPDGKSCSSTTASAGTCAQGGDLVGEGKGVLCSTRPGNDTGDGTPWLFGGAMSLLLAWRRRERAA